MATTTNFGWETPDDTDLVKDGALSIRTLGNSIDTSLVDLKGGTTGQVLSKASNTDMDFTWVTDAGDIAGVTAGVGITGGGTSGTVTITNDMATKIDAKGDLVIGTGADTYDRLAIGTNGYVLTADSTQTTGTKWAAVSGPAFGVYRGTSSQSITQNTYTKVQWNTESFDTDGCFDSSTNYRFTPTLAGKYQINLVGLLSQSAASRTIWVLYKNGSAYCRIIDGTPGAASTAQSGAIIVDMNGSTDYLEMYVYSAAATTTVDVLTSGAGSFFTGSYLRS